MRQTAPMTEAFVALVSIDDEHQRRVVRLTLKAAERVVERARERGQRAEVVLCRLVPVNVVTTTSAKRGEAA